MRTLLLIACCAWLGCESSNNNNTTTGGTTGGTNTPNGSCDTRTQNTACQEYIGPVAVVQPYKDACEPNGGVWSDSGCDKAGTVGGCRTTDASLMLTYTNWFFAPFTTAGIQAGCTAPGMFIPP